MSMDKAIESGKEHRKKYYGSKAIDKSCRCHGGCSVCLGNRMYQYKKKKKKCLTEKRICDIINIESEREVKL